MCVVGAGPSGLAAALAAARQGKRVLLVEEQSDLGGSLRHRAAVIDGVSGADWAAPLRAPRCGMPASRSCAGRPRSVSTTTMSSTVVQKDVPASPNGERIWLVRAGRIVVATGAIERPLLFANNDRPGVMLADAALVYLRRYAVKLGERVVVATNNDSAYELAIALRHAGSDVQLVDSRADADLDPRLVRRGAWRRRRRVDRRCDRNRDRLPRRRSGDLEQRTTYAGRPGRPFGRLDAEPASLLPCQGQAAVG